jgi:hypothetical protein
MRHDLISVESSGKIGIAPEDDQKKESGADEKSTPK